MNNWKCTSGNRRPLCRKNTIATRNKHLKCVLCELWMMTLEFGPYWETFLHQYNSIFLAFLFFETFSFHLSRQTFQRVTVTQLLYTGCTVSLASLSAPHKWLLFCSEMKLVALQLCRRLLWSQSPAEAAETPSVCPHVSPVLEEFGCSKEARFRLYRVSGAGHGQISCQSHIFSFWSLNSLLLSPCF